MQLFLLIFLLLILNFVVTFNQLVGPQQQQQAIRKQSIIVVEEILSVYVIGLFVRAIFCFLLPPFHLFHSGLFCRIRNILIRQLIAKKNATIHQTKFVYQIFTQRTCNLTNFLLTPEHIWRGLIKLHSKTDCTACKFMP